MQNSHSVTIDGLGRRHSTRVYRRLGNKIMQHLHEAFRLSIGRTPWPDPHARAMGDHQQIQQYREVRRYVRRNLRGSDEAEDIVQEVFLRFHANAKADSIDRPISYLMSIARNLLIDRSRRPRAMRHMLSIDDIDDHALAVAPRQEDARCAADLARAYEAALAELSPRCREVFQRRRLDEIDTSSTAAQFGISPRMVQKYMTRATAHLEDRLIDFTGGGRARVSA